MQSFAKEFFQVAKAHEYSDLLEDTEWGLQNKYAFANSSYSDLLEDTDWSTRTDDLTVA